MHRLLAIRVSDDLPSDEKSGPVIHSISVKVNGQIRPEVEPFIVRLNKRGDDRQSYMAGLLCSGDRKPLPPLANDYQSINRGSSYNTYDPYINYAAFDVLTFITEVMSFHSGSIIFFTEITNCTELIM